MSTTSSLFVVVVYLIVLKAIAIFAHRRSGRSIEEYLLATRSIGGPILWLTIIATILNSLAFSAVPGLLLNSGVIFLQMWIIVLFVPLAIRVFGPRVNAYARKHQLVSQGEYFGHFYDSKTIRHTIATLQIVAVLPFMVIQLAALAKAVELALPGLSTYGITIAVFSAATGLYILVGGVRAVILTDAFQGFCLLVILLVTVGCFYVWSGGYTAALETILAEKPDYFVFTPKASKVLLNNLLSWPFAFFLWPQVFQRMFMAKSENEVRRSALPVFLLFAFAMSLIMSAGVFATSQFIGKGVSADTLLVQMYQQFLPAGVTLLMLGLVASGMSTLDSGLFALTSVVVRDIFNSKSKISIGKARLVSVALLFIISCFATSELCRGAIAPLVTLGASFAALIIWPLLGATFITGVSARTIALTLFAGSATIGLSSAGFLAVGPGIAGFAASATTFLLCLSCQSIISRRPEKPVDRLLVSDF